MAKNGPLGMNGLIYRPSSDRVLQSWALEVFLNFFNNKNLFFAFFIKLIWLGVGFSNKTGAEIGYQLFKKYKKIIFYYWKKFKTTSSAQLWTHCLVNRPDYLMFGYERTMWWRKMDQRKEEDKKTKGRWKKIKEKEDKRK